MCFSNQITELAEGGVLRNLTEAWGQLSWTLEQEQTVVEAEAWSFGTLDDPVKLKVMAG